MADYYPLLSRAIGALDPNTAENRRSVYERARQAIVTQLRGYDPPLSESEITRERLALEEAVRKIEGEMRVSPPRAAAPPVPAPAPRAAPKEARPPQVSIDSTGDVASQAAFGARAAEAEMTARASTQRAPVSAPARPRINPPRLDSQRRLEDFPASDARLPGVEATPLGSRSRWPAIAAVLAVLVLAGLGGWAYFARDQLSATLGSEPAPVGTPTVIGPKIADRVGQSSDAPAVPAEPSSSPSDTLMPPSGEMATVTPGAAPGTTAPPPGPASLVAQRAILYEETPDQKGGTAFPGSIVWRTEPAANNAAETVLRGEVTIPERDVTVAVMMQRNTDPTLPASHTIDIQFTLPPDFPNAGIGSVPGILFKPSEEAGGAALSGLSVKVTNNFFLVGLSAAPKDLAENMKAIRERGWIDIPLLYENGRRAVLTLEKGVPGERAFEEALAAWSNATPVTGSRAPGVPAPR